MSKEQGKSKKSGRLYLIAKILLILAGLLLALIIGMAFAVLGSQPKYKPNDLNSSQIMLQSQILNRMLPDIMKSKPGDICQIELNEEEVNSIITLIENGGRLADFFSPGKNDGPQIQPVQNYKVVFQNKKFDISLAVDANLFNSYIRFNLQGIPEITEKDATLKVESASAGALPLPRDFTASVIKSQLEDAKNKAAYKLVREIVISAAVTPEGKLLITYHPDKLKSIFLKNIFN